MYSVYMTVEDLGMDTSYTLDTFYYTFASCLDQNIYGPRNIAYLKCAIAMLFVSVVVQLLGVRVSFWRFIALYSRLMSDMCLRCYFFTMVP